MASGTVGYTDTRSEKNYLGSIAKSIGNRLKQASNMASEERAYASKRAEDGGTSLEEAGIGKGYFFKRALGSRFGGDRIARTRGRLGATGPAKDPTKNYKQRFRGGFDYNITNEIQSATVPLSGALVSGLRGVETGLSGISSALATMGSGMSDLARGQNDLAKATYYNGMILRVMVSEIKRQQARLAGRREERSLEGGRPRLSGGGSGGDGRRMINVTPQSRNFSTGNIAAIPSALTNPVVRLGGSAAKGAQTGLRRGISSAAGTVARPVLQVGSAVKSGVSNAAKYAPDIGKLAQATAKYLGTPVSAARNFFGKSVKSSSGVTKRASQTAAFLDAQADMIASGFGGLGKNTDNTYQMLRNLDVNNDLLAKVYAGAGTNYDFVKILEAGGYEGNFAQALDPNFLPPGSSGTLANSLSPDQAKALAPSRIAALDNAGYKAAEIATDQLVKSGTKEGLKRGSGLARMMVKQFGSAGAKSILKKIPVIAGVAGILFGIQRAMEGDFLGAGLEVTSGLLGATGVGGGAGLAIDGYLLARDFGVVPMAKGGLLTGKAPVNALMGEAGPEIVTPLNDETFIKFGEGFIDAAKRNQRDYSKVLAAGNAEYFNKQPWWQDLVTGLANMLPKIEIKIPEITWPWQKGNNNSNPGGGRVRPGATAGSDTLNIGSGGGQMNLSDEQYKWLAYAISGEAGPGDDQYAVAASILNRVAEGRGTVEQVVKADGQYEAYHKGMMSMSPEIEARLKSAEGQARLVAALERLQGRTDFKGQTQLQNRVAGEDPMVDALGNFFHYSWQTGANSQMPSNYQMPNYQQFIKRANTGSDAALKNSEIMQKWMQSIGGADQQANVLGMNSTNASLAGFQMVTPTIVNNNYYTTGNQSSDDGGVINPGFGSMNLSAFTLPYSLAAKN